MDCVAARGALAFPPKPAGHPVDRLLYASGEGLARRGITSDLRPKRSDGAAGPRMIAMRRTQVVVKEGLLLVLRLRR